MISTNVNPQSKNQLKIHQRILFWSQAFRLGQILNIVIVVLLFQHIADKQTAAVIAGALFLALGLIGLFMGYWVHKETGRPWFRNPILLTSALFLIASALPIAVLRLIHWGQPFSELSLMGISANDLHKSANGFYLLFVLGSIIEIRFFLVPALRRLRSESP